jgi:hypothetical protein
MGVNIKKQSYKKEGAKNNLPMLAVRYANIRSLSRSKKGLVVNVQTSNPAHVQAP